MKAGKKKITVEDASDKVITLSEDGSIKTFQDGVIFDGTNVVVPAKYKSKAQKTFDATITIIDASEAKKKVNLAATSPEGVTLVGGKGNDTLAGSSGDDYIQGEKGKDVLYGGAGKDFLWGCKGNDTLYGGEGIDAFIYCAGEGKDVIADYAQGDILQIFNKKQTDYADIKSATFKNDTLTLNVQGGGKVLVTGENFNSNTSVNINGTSQTVSEWTS